jgi:GNAT superfamily N-acetyltransferase
VALSFLQLSDVHVMVERIGSGRCAHTVPEVGLSADGVDNAKPPRDPQASTNEHVIDTRLFTPPEQTCDVMSTQINQTNAEQGRHDFDHGSPIVVEFTGAVKLILDEDVDHVVMDGHVIDDRLWELAGAFDGSELTVTLEETRTVWGPVKSFVLTVRNEVLLEKPMVRKIIHVDGDDEISVMDNVEFYLRAPFRGQGIGRASLYVEAVAAYELGFSKILANAANPPDAGWVVWPKLGYDADIDDDILANMQGDLISAGFIPHGKKVRISELTEQGLYWIWERYGRGCIMEFDVSAPDSWSMSILAGAKSSEE